MALFDTPTKSQLLNNAAKEINTLVFLKVDTNDVANGRISEICAIAVHMKELMNTTSPRIVDKLSLCVNPMASFDKHLSYLTKLDNSAVAHKKKFDDNAMGIFIQFLLRQSGPVCLLSHNGFRLDFQILCSVLKHLKCSLDILHNKEVLCCDALWTFKEMDNKQFNDADKSAKKLGVSFLDTMYYTLPSLVHRFLNKSMPQSLSAEEKSLYLLELVSHVKIPFLQSLCCKRFAQVKPMTSTIPCPVLSPLNSSDNRVVSSQTLSTQTFVFFDLETTALVNAKITEISLVAVHVSCLLSALNGELPRVQDKLLLILNPEGIIGEVASTMSKLSNSTINESEKPEFNEKTVYTIAQFLQQQAGPLCLVAHNGNRFDFPILLRHFGKQRETFPVLSSMQCSDSLTAMQKMWKSNNPGKATKRSRGSGMPSFKLQTIYQRLFPNSRHTFHHAEADTSALIQICCKMPGLLKQLDQQKRLL